MKPILMICLALPIAYSSCLAAESATGSSPSKPVPTRQTLAIQQHPQLSLNDFLDDLFDYNVYMADPDSATGWYIRWTYSDGVVMYTAPSQSEEYSLDLMVRLLLRGYDPRNWMRQGLDHPLAEVVELQTTPNWIFAGTFDSLSEAEATAALLQDSGMLTRVESQDAFQLFNLPLSP